jgi:hypothetical protein
LELTLEVSFAQGLTSARVSDETIRRGWGALEAGQTVTDRLRPGVRAEESARVRLIRLARATRTGCWASLT